MYIKIRAHTELIARALWEAIYIVYRATIIYTYII